MENKCIKDVDVETWREFKSLAAKNKIKMSVLLKIMVNNFEKDSEDFWNEILGHKKTLSNKEAEDIEKIISDSRKKDRWFKE